MDRATGRLPFAAIAYAPVRGSADEPVAPGPLVVMVEPQAEVGDAPRFWRPDTVMVVEPLADELQRITRALSSHGYRVVPVEDGHTALDWAEVFRPQAIVLSCALSDCDARDLLVWLRQTAHGNTLRIVMVVDPGQCLSAADRARATAVLERPPDIHTLLAILSQDGLVATSAT